jgi:hypothetical protein
VEGKEVPQTVAGCVGFSFVPNDCNCKLAVTVAILNGNANGH